jgi:hypothetical protein
MAADRFDRGHWFRGRIYEKRCDLSPDGELLVYFASKFNRDTISDSEYTYAWTAVSRVPWLTALALWPKGDCWHGGGLFTGNRSLWLNHKPAVAVPHPAHKPTGLKVEPNPEASGEDEPIYARRLERDGWILQEEWQTEWRGMPEFYVTAAPERRIKPQPVSQGGLRLALIRRIDGLDYREQMFVEGATTEVEYPPGPLHWLDWDPRGRLVALSGGRIWAAEVANDTVARFAELIDLRGDEFEERSPPPDALRW